MDQDHQHLAEARDMASGTDQARGDGIRVLPNDERRRLGSADIFVALAGLTALAVILLLIVF